MDFWSTVPVNLRYERKLYFEAIGIYFGMLIMLKCKELITITNLIKRKFTKSR